ncbi:MAG: glycosyltransferase, partial [Alphaproteobacteria bacterium]|nr:glycosyltransferase [Alphaproteobacteria bacterium]
FLRQAIASVRSQLYPYWELCVADDASPSPHVAEVLAEAAVADARIKWVRREKNGHIAGATNTVLGLATGPFVALMDHDDLLAEHALYEVAVALNAHPNADLIYTDEDHIDEAGRRHTPYFKPDWNYDLLLGHNLVSHLGVYRRSLVERLGGLRAGLEGSQDYDLALRVVAATSPDRIHHIPAVLYHWRRTGGLSFSELYLDKCTNAARRAIVDHLQSIGGRTAEAEVLPHPTIAQWTRIRWQLPDSPPRVSIIVPTRDRASLLAQCASGVLHRTDYPDIELIIIDNDSVEPETKVLLRGLARDPRVRILPFTGPFNYSAINNFAVQQATGEIVVLLNNDTIVIGADWLREMVSHVMRPMVGAVGAKLLYPDDTIQHGGVVLGIGSFDGGPGVAGHFGHGQPRDEPGYFGQNALTRELSACTGACLALRRDVYQGIGGLDGEHLPVAFNDVDLCIRLRQRGYKIIWTPFAELYHLESASRGLDLSEEKAARFNREAAYMRKRWGLMLDNDPFYNLSFSRVDALFSLAFPPFREKPWQRPIPLPPASPLQSRSEILLAPIPRDGKILEIGPSYGPVAPKSEGWNTKVLDYTAQDGLVAKYTGHPGIDIGRIEEVDFIWRGGKLCDAVPVDERGTFDACIASHVIEHTPDLISFLNSIEVLLKEDGVVALAVPDKRYCFDYFRPLTTTGQVLYAHMEARSRHSPQLTFDFAAYRVENGGSVAWGQHPSKELRFLHSLDMARGLSQQVQDSEDYVDVHAWCFVPASFELILFELAMLGETDLRVERTTPAQGCEFLCWLRRGGKAVVAAMSEAEKADVRLALLKRIMLETRAQVDWLLAGEPDLANLSRPAALSETGPALSPVAPALSPQPTEPADKIDSNSIVAPTDPMRTIARFVDWMPAVENAARIFDGDWSSDVPGLPGTGQASLFDDHRILWFERYLGGYQGKRVLELGPLEGGHTHMMTSRGAEVLAIESNTKAWMRCLVVKNHLDMRGATFLLGDFQQYLDSDPPPRFDFVLASGVLYHMTDPVRLLLGIARTTDAIGLWTHYFDKDVLRAKEDARGKFSFQPRRITTLRGRPVRYYDQAYLQALDWAGFCGGSAPGSVWMARDDILDVLGDEGFTCETGIEDIDHPNGPAFCIFAQRR